MRSAETHEQQTPVAAVQLGGAQHQHGAGHPWWDDGALLKPGNLGGAMPPVSQGLGSSDAQQPCTRGAAPLAVPEGPQPHSGMPGNSCGYGGSAGGLGVAGTAPMCLGTSPEGSYPSGTLAGAQAHPLLALPAAQQRTLSWDEAQRLLSRWDSGADTQEVVRLGVSPSQQQQLLLQALQQQDTSPLLLPLRHQETVPSTLAAAADSVEAEGCSSGRSSTDGSNRQRGAAAAAVTRTKAPAQAAASPFQGATAAAAAAVGGVAIGNVQSGTAASALRGVPVAAAAGRLQEPPRPQQQQQQQGEVCLQAPGGLLARPRRTSSHSSGRYSASSCSSGSAPEEEEEEGMGSTCATPRSRLTPQQQPDPAWEEGAEAVEGEGQDRPPQHLVEWVTQARGVQPWSDAGPDEAAMPCTHVHPSAPAAAGVGCSGAGTRQPPAAHLQQQAEQLQALLLELAAAQEALGLGSAMAAADTEPDSGNGPGCWGTGQQGRPAQQGLQQPQGTQLLGGGWGMPEQQAEYGVASSQLQQQQQVAGVQGSAARTAGGATAAAAHPGHPVGTTPEDVPMRDQDPFAAWAPGQEHAKGPGTHSAGALGMAGPPEGASKKRAMLHGSSSIMTPVHASTAPGTSSMPGGDAALEVAWQQHHAWDTGARVVAATPSPTAAAAAGTVGLPGASSGPDPVHHIFADAVRQEQQRGASAADAGAASGGAAGAGAGIDTSAAAAGGTVGQDLADLISRMLEEELAHQQTMVGSTAAATPRMT